MSCPRGSNISAVRIQSNSARKCWRFSNIEEPVRFGPPPATSLTGLPQVWPSMHRKVWLLMDVLFERFARPLLNCKFLPRCLCLRDRNAVAAGTAAGSGPSTPHSGRAMGHRPRLGMASLDGTLVDRDVRRPALRASNAMHDSMISASDGSAFREAMSRVAGAVHVVATGGKAGLGGATATAVTSVSDSPPSLLVCLNQASATLEKIRRNGAFSVNVLSGLQKDVAQVFAGQGSFEGEARFRQTDGWVMEVAIPRLSGALASFSCRLYRPEDGRQPYHRDRHGREDLAWRGRR